MIKTIWVEELKEMLSKVDETKAFPLTRKIYQTKQDTLNITLFFLKVEVSLGWINFRIWCIAMYMPESKRLMSTHIV